ncbi:MAG: NAD(P) transhydrogenase subunit alpha [Lachnospiraceae bacterium]|nr:NAD(P) transhydrogenase subunit alpha [Lachnospiraceae bacterium]
MKELTLVGVFIVASVLGYLIIKKVPPLLHTPLMSGMNALSGVTVLGALIAGAAAYAEKSAGLLIVAVIAAALAMINVTGGFSVTHRMLMMFRKKDNKEEKK